MKSLVIGTGVLARISTGCSTRIFDIKTKADRETVAESASKGLGINTNDFKEMRPIPKTMSQRITRRTASSSLI